MKSMSPFSNRALLAGLMLSLVCLTTSVRAQDAVVDGGFEAAPPPSNPMDPLGPGPFSAAWTVVDPSGAQPPGSEGSNSNVGHDPLLAHSGTDHANLGATPNVGTLTQTLTTTPGQTYTLSFWLANDGGAGGGEVNQFDALWNGTPVLTQTNVPVSLYTQYTFTVVAPTASTTLEFDYRNDDDFFRLDDVSATVAVPEPSLTWLVLAGLPLLALAARRSAKSAR